MTGVDYSRAAADYAKYRKGFPAALFERLRQAGVVAPGQRLLDIGTGSGNLARGFARHGLAVTAQDIAPGMIEAARRLAAAESLEIAFAVAPAEANGLPDASFDVVSAGMCWHWLDRAAAAREVRRVLRPGGRLLLVHFHWLPLPGNAIEAVDTLVAHHQGSAPKHGTGMFPRFLTDLAIAGFEGLETFSFDQTLAYRHEEIRGHVRGSACGAAIGTPAAVEALDRALAAKLADRFPEPVMVPHRCWVAIGRAPG